MKQVHNCRLRIIDSDNVAIAKLFSSILAAAGIKPEDAAISVTDDGTGEIYQGELWLDRQQPVRKFLKLLKQKLSTEEQQGIANHPSEHLDTQTHCFLQLNKQALLRGEWTLAGKEESAVIRLNIAAFPATKENAERILSEIFNNNN